MFVRGTDIRYRAFSPVVNELLNLMVSMASFSRVCFHRQGNGFLFCFKTDVPQIMDHIPASHEQYPVLTEFRQPLPHFKMLFFSFVDVETHLEQRNVFRRIHMLHHGPCGMVDSALRVFRYPKARVCDQGRRFRRAAGGIFQPVQLVGKAPEIIDLLGGSSACDEGPPGLPVGRNDDDGFRLRDFVRVGAEKPGIRLSAIAFSGEPCPMKTGFRTAITGLHSEQFFRPGRPGGRPRNGGCTPLPTSDRPGP